MSTTEILEELPRLNPSDLEVVDRRAVELHQGRTVEATPELLVAMDEADALWVKEGGVSVEEARVARRRWEKLNHRLCKSKQKG